jgi:pilus assembly protein Flp/PilA
MNTISTAVKTFIDDEAGITAIEYGMIAALMAAALTVIVKILTDGLGATFTKIVAAMTK